MEGEKREAGRLAFGQEGRGVVLSQPKRVSSILDVYLQSWALRTSHLIYTYIPMDGETCCGRYGSIPLEVFRRVLSPPYCPPSILILSGCKPGACPAGGIAVGVKPPGPPGPPGPPIPFG